MATTLPAALQPGILLTTTAAIIAAAPSATQQVIKSAVFSNVSAGPVTISLSHTTAGGSLLVLIKSQTIAVNSQFIAYELANLVLNPGDTIGAVCNTAGAVNAFIYGYSVV